jgi:hypothetical protein
MRSSLPTSHYFVPAPRPGVPPANNPLPPTGKSNFVSQFEYTGAVDAAPFLCVEEALRFRRDVCGGKSYNPMPPGYVSLHLPEMP